MSSNPAPPPAPEPYDRGSFALERIFIGPDGLRAGWSVLLAYCLFYFFRLVIGTFFVTAGLVDDNSGFRATPALILETIPFLAMIGAGAIVAVIERRRLLDYNLTGPLRISRFASGLLTGFTALSILIGAL